METNSLEQLKCHNQSEKRRPRHGEEHHLLTPLLYSRPSEMFPQRFWGSYLNSHHWQNLHWDPVELIEAAPGSSLGQTFVDVSTGLGNKETEAQRPHQDTWTQSALTSVDQLLTSFSQTSCVFKNTSHCSGFVWFLIEDEVMKWWCDQLQP